jgi:hypothetical protein
LCVTAVRRYGLTIQEFYRLTPYEYLLLTEDYNEERETEDSRFALIAVLIANAHRGKRKAFKIEDFMPKRTGKRAEKPRQTVEEQLQVAKAITMAFGGSIAPRLGAPDPKIVHAALEKV